jgi:Toprim domain
MSLCSVSDIADEFNGHAKMLAKELLPNGHQSGNYWMASGVDDSGKNASLAVKLSGAGVGHWTDYGNAAIGEDRGDMIDLLALRRFGGDRKKALQDVKRRLGIEDKWTRDMPQPTPQERAAASAAARQRELARQAAEQDERAGKIRGARALFLHKDARLLAGSPAEAYLQARGLSPDPIGEWPGSLRYHPEVWNRQHRVKIHAMLAMVYAWDGARQQHLATHRTYLQRDPKGQWTKIDGPNARMALGPWGGGFIPINKGSSGKSMTEMHEDEPVYMAEGIEKCIAIRMKMPGARIISGLNLRNLGAVVLPPQCRRLVMVVDNDKDEREMAAMERAIARQQARGLHVQLVRPPLPYKDIDDWMIAVAPEPVEVLPQSNPLRQTA